MRVVHIVDKLNVGGAQTQILTFATLSKISGVDLTVVSLWDDENSIVKKQLEELEIKVVSFSAPKLFHLQRFVKLTRFLRIGKFDIIQTHLQYANIIGSIAGYISHTPVIATLHSTGHPTGAAFFKDILENFVISFFSRKIIAVGYKVAEIYSYRIKKTSMVVILNAVLDIVHSAKNVNSVRKELNANSETLILISVGRLSPPKGYDDLLMAFTDVHRVFPNTLLIIIGNGPLFSMIKSQIINMGLENSVLLLGERSDISRFLMASDIYVSSSIWEGLPMAVLEAMMVGLPIVATDVGDVAKIVPHTLGYVVPAHNPKLLAEAVKLILHDTDTRLNMRKAVREYAKLNFSADIWMNKVLDLYSSVLNN